MIINESGILRLEVRRAVLETKEVARCLLGRRCRRRPTEAELRPTHVCCSERDPREVPDGVHRDLRIVRARLDAEVTTALRRIQCVARELREIHKRSGTLVGQTECGTLRSGKQRRTEPEREGEPTRGKSQCFAGVIRRSVVGAPVAPNSPAAAPRVIRSAAAVHTLKPHQVGARRRRQIECREVQSVLSRSHDA